MVFQNLHLDKARLTVVAILAPQPEYPGQLVSLELMTGLANLVLPLPLSRNPYLLVKLTGCWQSKGKPNQSLKVSLTGYRHGHDVVILPFTRLAARWRYKHEISEDLLAVLRTETSPRKSLLYHLKGESTCLAGDPFHPIDEKSLRRLAPTSGV